MPSTRSQGNNLAPPVPELERFLYVRRRIHEYQQKYDIPDIFSPSKPEEKPTMAEKGPHNRPLKFYATPSQQEPHNNIAAPTINRNDFELKPSLLSTVQQHQFAGNPTDDPNEHLTKFEQYANTLKAKGVSQDAIRLRLFPFSLRDRAWAWLQSLPSNSVTTWEELKNVFLSRYFPPSKTAMPRAQINGF